MAGKRSSPCPNDGVGILDTIQGGLKEAPRTRTTSADATKHVLSSFKANVEPAPFWASTVKAWVNSFGRTAEKTCHPRTWCGYGIGVTALQGGGHGRKQPVQRRLHHHLGEGVEFGVTNDLAFRSSPAETTQMDKLNFTGVGASVTRRIASRRRPNGVLWPGESPRRR